MASFCGIYNEKEQVIKYCSKVREILEHVQCTDANLCMIIHKNLYNAFVDVKEFDKAMEEINYLNNLSKQVGEKGKEIAIHTLICLGSLNEKKGESEVAINYFDLALSAAKEVYKEDNAIVAAIYETLGYSYSNKGELMKGIEFYIKTEQILKKIYGDKNYYVANNNMILGNLYTSIYNYSWAIEYYQRSKAIFMKLYEENHMGIGNLCLTIGFTYSLINENEQALKNYQEAEKILKFNHKEGNILYHQLYADYILLYLNLNKLDLASQYCKKMFKLTQAHKNEYPLLFIESYIMTGIIYDKKKEHKIALEYFYKAKEIYEKQEKEANNIITELYFHIGLCLESLMDHKTSIIYLHKAVEINNSLYTDKSPQNVEIYYILGCLYKIIGDYSNSEEYFIKCFNIYMAYEIDSEKLGLTLSNLGEIYFLNKDYTKSIEYYNEAVNWCENQIKETYLAVNLENLATAYKAQGSYDKAFTYFNRALIEYQKEIGNSHKIIAKINTQLGCISQKLGNIKEAFIYIKCAEKILDKLQDNIDPINSESFFIIGDLYFTARDYNKAIKYTESALFINKQLKEKININVLTQSYFLLMESYYLSSQYKRVIQLCEKCEVDFAKFRVVEPMDFFNLYSKWGTAYTKMFQFDIAIEILNRGLRLYNNLGGKSQIIVAALYGRLGLNYCFSKQFKIGLIHLHYAKTMFCTDKFNLCNIYCDLATAYEILDECTTCFNYLEKAAFLLTDGHPNTMIIYIKLEKIYGKIGNKKKLRETRSKMEKFIKKYPYISHS